LEEHTDLYHTDIDVGIVNAALDLISGKRHAVELHLDVMLNKYILPFSSSILDDHVLGVEV
jgi:hypothetical protein